MCYPASLPLKDLPMNLQPDVSSRLSENMLTAASVLQSFLVFPSGLQAQEQAATHRHTDPRQTKDFSLESSTQNSLQLGKDWQS